MTNPYKCIINLFLFMGLISCSPAETPKDKPQDDVSFYVLVKSANYSQNADDELTFLNNHMFSEIFVNEGRDIKGASLTRPDAPHEPMDYFKREGTYYVEGGHFNSETGLDAAYPNGDFTFDIQLNDRDIHTVMSLKGPKGKTDIPKPITIFLFQEGEKVRPDAVDPTKKLTVKWSEYSNGSSDPNGIVDDMIFVVMADCYGDRIIHTGLPFQEGYTKFDVIEKSVEGEFLKSGHPYSMFVEFPHVVDSNITKGLGGFTSYATATYLDIKTLGPDTSASCPTDKIPMDTGQTDRMEMDERDSNPLLPEVTEHYTMLYYSDETFQKATSFYKNTLGFKSTYEDDWVKLLQITPQSYLGLVKESKDAYYKAQTNNAVMVSIVSQDVMAYYESLKGAENITIEHEPKQFEGAPIKNFTIRDPGNYAIEFFEWVKP